MCKKFTNEVILYTLDASLDWITKNALKATIKLGVNYLKCIIIFFKKGIFFKSLKQVLNVINFKTVCCNKSFLILFTEQNLALNNMSSIIATSFFCRKSTSIRRVNTSLVLFNKNSTGFLSNLRPYKLFKDKYYIRRLNDHLTDCPVIKNRNCKV